MIAIVVTIGVLVVVWLLQAKHPGLAGILAVLPVKILATGVMTWQTGPSALRAAIGGMLVGQFALGVLLLIVWIWLGR